MSNLFKETLLILVTLLLIAAMASSLLCIYIVFHIGELTRSQRRMQSLKCSEVPGLISYAKPVDCEARRFNYCTYDEIDRCTILGAIATVSRYSKLYTAVLKMKKGQFTPHRTGPATSHVTLQGMASMPLSRERYPQKGSGGLSNNLPNSFNGPLQTTWPGHFLIYCVWNFSLMTLQLQVVELLLYFEVMVFVVAVVGFFLHS